MNLKCKTTLKCVIELKRIIDLFIFTEYQIYKYVKVKTHISNMVPKMLEMKKNTYYISDLRLSCRSRVVQVLRLLSDEKQTQGMIESLWIASGVKGNEQQAKCLCSYLSHNQ